MNSNYFLKQGYQSRLEPKYHDESEAPPSETLIYQPEVYEVAGRLAEHLKREIMIDLGCGSARKLIQFHPSRKVVGVDYGKNIEACRNNYPDAMWIEADFESARSLPIDDAFPGQSVVVCSDVIEHLKDPTNLLKLFRFFCERGAVVVVSTPERNLKNGLQDNGPPSNTHHIREWTLAELSRLMESESLALAYEGLTQTHNQSPARNTILLVLAPRSMESLPADLFPPSLSFFSYWNRVLRKSFGVWRNRNPLAVKAGNNS